MYPKRVVSIQHFYTDGNYTLEITRVVNDDLRTRIYRNRRDLIRTTSAIWKILAISQKWEIVYAHISPLSTFITYRMKWEAQSERPT